MAHTSLLLLLAFLPFYAAPLAAQQLTLGLNLKGAVQPAAQANESGLRLHGGLSADFQPRNGKLGMRLELSLIKAKGPRPKLPALKQLQIPALFTFPLNATGNWQLFSGPQLRLPAPFSIERAPEAQRGWDWGLVFGTSFNTPLFTRWILLTDARLQGLHQAGSVPAEGPPPSATRKWSISLSLGLGYRFRKRKK